MRAVEQHPPRAAGLKPGWLGVLAGLLVWLAPAAARADDALNASRLPLSKTFEQPFFSLNGSHVELFSLLFLFLSTVVVMSVERRRQLVRHVVQLLSLFIFFFIVFSCLGVFGMLRNSIHGVTLIGTVYTEAFFWLSLPVCVVAFTIISGPFFCGWICPTGTIQELVAMGRELLTRGRQIRLNRVTGALLAVFTAAFLYVVFTVSAERKLFVEDSSLYWAACSLLVPLLVLTGLASDRAARHLRMVSLGSILLSASFKVTITSPVHFAFVDVVDPASAITTGVLAVASVFVARSWCRYLCPWGVLMSLTHRFSRLRVVSNPQTDCDRCNKCVDVCRIGAIETLGKVDYELCQFCYACVDVCSRQRLSIVDVWAEQQADKKSTPPQVDR
jgi:polyferredoxin